MNLYKTALSLIICTASASARLSSDEKDSSAVMRELMAKVDSMQSEVASLKSKVASLEKRRGLVDMPDLEGIELPDMSDMDVKGLTDLLGVEVDPSSGGGPLYDLLSGITSTLLGVTNCVGFELEFDRRRLSSKRRLEGYGYEPIPICFFGGEDVNVVIEGDEFIELVADDIDDFSFDRLTETGILLTDVDSMEFGPTASTEEKKAKLQEKKADIIAKHQGN